MKNLLTKDRRIALIEGGWQVTEATDNQWKLVRCGSRGFDRADVFAAEDGVMSLAVYLDQCDEVNEEGYDNIEDVIESLVMEHGDSTQCTDEDSDRLARAVRTQLFKLLPNVEGGRWDLSFVKDTKAVQAVDNDCTTVVLEYFSDTKQEVTVFSGHNDSVQYIVPPVYHAVTRRIAHVRDIANGAFGDGVVPLRLLDEHAMSKVLEQLGLQKVEAVTLDEGGTFSQWNHDKCCVQTCFNVDGFLDDLTAMPDVGDGYDPELSWQLPHNSVHNVKWIESIITYCNR